MANSSDLNIGINSKNESNFKRDSQESRQNNMQNSVQGNMQNTMPEVLTNPIYTPAFLREQIGKLMRVEFLIGTNNLTDRIGILEDVGASYILLRSIESNNLIFCDIYSIKFITISASNQYGMMNNQMMNNRYYPSY